jgi:hypothetical protein
VTGFAGQLHRPGISPDVVAIRLDDDEYHLRVPGPLELVDIAAAYRWPALLPGALIDGDADRMADQIEDPDEAVTPQRLHVVVQSLGSYLYGWPFFIAARALRLVQVYEPVFRCWAVMNLAGRLDGMSAPDWVSSAIAWRLSLESKEADRNAAWAELTIPGRLPEHAPGVTPAWMQASGMS